MGDNKVDNYALFLKDRQILLQDYDFKRGSTIGVGGVGKAVFPRSFTELIEVIDGCNQRGIPCRVLGALSNVLPPETDEKTLYVITRKLKGITMGDAPLVHAGVTSGELLRACKLHGKGGAEFLIGFVGLCRDKLEFEWPSQSRA